MKKQKSRLKQANLAKELGISKSYLSMILLGRRKLTPELAEKLQTIPGVHNFVNNDIWNSSYTQEVRGSTPLPPTTKAGSLLTGQSEYHMLRQVVKTNAHQKFYLLNNLAYNPS